MSAPRAGRETGHRWRDSTNSPLSSLPQEWRTGSQGVVAEVGRRSKASASRRERHRTLLEIHYLVVVAAAADVARGGEVGSWSPARRHASDEVGDRGHPPMGLRGEDGAGLRNSPTIAPLCPSTLPASRHPDPSRGAPPPVAGPRLPPRGRRTSGWGPGGGRPSDPGAGGAALGWPGLCRRVG